MNTQKKISIMIAIISLFIMSEGLSADAKNKYKLESKNLTIKTVTRISAQIAKNLYYSGQCLLFDVPANRKFITRHICGAIEISPKIYNKLDQMNLQKLPKNKIIVIY